MASSSLFLLIALFGVTAALRDQSIAVKGKLVCGGKPASGVRVKLWEEDGGPDPDDLLDQGYTQADGSFSLQGGTAELTPIDPVFKVYHDCDDGVLPGSRKVKFGLPKSYITEGKVAKKTFDIGVLNLETIFAKEEREMIVSRRRREGANADYLDDGNTVSESENTQRKKFSQHKESSSSSSSSEEKSERNSQKLKKTDEDEDQDFF